MKKIQLKNKSKAVYTVLIEDEIWGILPYKVLRFFSLKPDSFEIDDIQTEKLKEEIEIYVWDKLLNYISYRERSTWECRNYLRLLPVPAEMMVRLNNKAHDLNFVNDERFAEIYVQDLIRKGKSRREISNKLFEKKIPGHLIEQKLQECFTMETKEEIIDQNVLKALRKYSRFSGKERKEKCFNYLSRRGFAYSEVNEKINELIMKE